MTSNPDHLMGGMSRSQLESITVLEDAENPLRELKSEQHFAATSRRLSRSEEPKHQEHEPIENQEDNNTGSYRQSPAPPRDKQHNEMTFRELNYLVSHLSNKSEGSQQALAEIKQRPEYLKHASSSVFATGDDIDMEYSISTPPRSTLQPSTTPIGPPPYNLDGLPHALLSQPLPQKHSLPISFTSPTRPSADSSKYLVPSCTRSLAHAEELIQNALPQSIAHRSAGLPSWIPPTNDPWAIPSPLGAAVQTDYVTPPSRDVKVLGDHTAFVAEQAWLAVNNLPPAMGFIEYLPPRKRRGTPRSFTNELPASISKEVEGWRLSYWFRRFPDVELKDIANRIILSPGQTSRTKEELKVLCNQLSMRHQRWCEKEGGFMFSRAGKNKVSSKQLEIIERSLLLNGFEGLERNTIWALDQSAGQMVQPMLKEANSYRGSRCIAPQRAVLRPRVDAAFKMYIGVVSESKSRGLADWRELEKENWPEGDDRIEEIGEQEDDHSIQDHTKDDIQMPHAQAFTSTHAQTMPPNYGASFPQVRSTQQFVPFLHGTSFAEQLYPTVSSPTPPPSQQQLLQRPISQRPQQSHFIQRQVATSYQHANNHQSLGPISHGLPLQPVIGTIPPTLYTLSSTRGPENDQQSTMQGMNMAASPATENKTAERLKQYDAKQLRKKQDFIDAQNQIPNQLVAQGVPWGEAHATGEQAIKQYTDAQQKNRMSVVQFQTIRGDATSFQQNNAPDGPKVFIDLTSPTPKSTRFTNISPHTPPTPSKAPDPKRMRFSPSSTFRIRPLVVARPLEPAARKIEIDDDYDDAEGEGLEEAAIIA